MRANDGNIGATGSGSHDSVLPLNWKSPLTRNALAFSGGRGTKSAKPRGRAVKGCQREEGTGLHKALAAEDREVAWARQRGPDP